MASGKQLSLADIPVVNVGKFMLDRMRGFGDKIALVDNETDTVITFRELVGLVERVASGLQKLDVRKGDVICITAPNHLHYLVCCYATCLISAVFQPINPTYTKDDIARAVEACKTKLIITTPQLQSKVKAALDDSGHVQVTVIVFGNCQGCVLFDDLLRCSPVSYCTPEINPKTTEALLLSSSGTTGFPKAVRVSHYNVIAHAFQISASGIIRPHDTCLLFLPLFHVYGLCTLSIPCHYNGGTIVIIPQFSVGAYLRSIEKYKPRVLNVVPAVMVRLARHNRLAQHDLTSVTSITCGAAPLSPAIEETIKRRFRINHIIQGYGLTETVASHGNTETEFRYGSVGKEMPLVETKIVDTATGEALGPGREGEVWVRGPQVSLGYLDMPTQTALIFRQDGWVRTGDVGKLDKDGYLYIVDRIKELIKYKGFQVAPAVLESMLLRHENVADVGVIGVPDEEAGELPKAYVVKRPGTDLTGEELINFVSGNVPPHMRLRGGVEFIDEIPRSLAGKILRKSLRLRNNARPSKL